MLGQISKNIRLFGVSNLGSFIIVKNLRNQINKRNQLIRKQIMEGKGPMTYTMYRGQMGLAKYLSFKSIYTFTSTSNPSVVPLLEQITAKVLQTIKQFNPNLFLPHSTGSKNPGNSINTNLKQKRLEQLGFDSLDVMEIIISLEEQMQIQLSEVEVLKLDTIDKIIDIFFMKANLRVMNKMVQVQDKDTGNIKIFRQ